MSKVSIIVPVYNSSEFLNRCIDSILSQSMSDFELILIDDGSSDGSAVICDSYSEQDNRVSVVHTTNGGVSNARNIGLSTAKCEYIMFVDSDDWIERELLKDLFDMVQTADLSMAGFEIRYPTFVNSYVPNRKVNISMDSFLSDFSFYYKTTIISSPCAKIYKKSILSKLRFDTSLRLGEDFDFNLKYFDRCKTVSVTDKTKYIYDCTNNLSSTKIYRKGDLKQLLTLNTIGHDFCDRHNITTQAECLDEYLCRNAIHSLDALAQSCMKYEDKRRESRLILGDASFRKACRAHYNELPFKIVVAKFLCLLPSYAPLYLFFVIKRYIKHIVIKM